MNINIKSLLIGTSLSLIPNLCNAQCTTAQTCASLGYTQTSCPNGGIKCPFGDGWYCRPEKPKATLGECTGYAKNCTIGQILNSDGTCTTNKENGKTPIGVVIAIKDNCGYAMTTTPIAFDIKWSTEYFTIGERTTDWQTAITNFDACSKTKQIIQQGDSTQYPAAWAAVNYSPAGASATKGKWCLPAPGMLNSLYINLNTINNTISKLGGTQLKEDNEHIWSSLAYDNKFMWILCTSNGASTGGIYRNGAHTGSNHYAVVRPVIDF